MNLKEIIKEVFRVEAEELNRVEVTESYINAIDLIYKTEGKLIITGVGKSGLVGAKISATFASTGTSSFFIHPTEAMHGDLGMIDNRDTVLAISYSGESEELIAILPHLKRFNIKLISICSSRDSTLAKYSDIFISNSVSKEACPLNSAPTTSTTLTLAIGDALAIALMKKRNFKKEDFASFHPGGSLGKKLFIKVKDLMRSEKLPVIQENSSLQEAIIKMTEGTIGNVLIVDRESRLKAILSDGDLRRALLDSDFSLKKKALDFATKNPKVLKDSNILASDALEIIEQHKIQILILIDEKNDTPKGILHIHDLIEAGIKR